MSTDKIVVETKQQSLENLQEKYPDAIIADVTIEAKSCLRRLSPLYPHGGIPIPNSGYETASCVEAIWQGLKVFENKDIDTGLFRKEDPKEVIRSSQEYGNLLGHRFGTNGLEILNYADAQRRILIPTYRWVLDYKVQDIIIRLRKVSETKTIVLLDYNTNCDSHNHKKPRSYAYLVKAYSEGLFPYEDAFETITHHHVRVIGRREISYITTERCIKEIKPYEIPQQLELPFDFKEDKL